MVKKAPARNRAGNPDFTFKDLNRAGIRFNSKAFIEIEYEADTEDVTITKTDEIGETVKTIVSNFDSPGGSVLGTKTITENGTYNASADELDGYSSVTVNVPASGGLSVDDFVTGSVPAGDVTLTAANLRYGALAYTSNLDSVNMPNVATISQFAFYHSNISDIYAPAFIGNTNGTSAFAYSKLKKITDSEFPNLTDLNKSGTTAVFESCTSALKIFLSKLKTTGQYTFKGCNALITAVLPAFDGFLGASSFENCTALNNIDILKPGFGAVAFKGCTNLNLMIIRSDTLVPLSAATVFQNTPFATTGTGGELYVPADLVTSYEQATNWSALNITVNAIENSFYETHYADGTEIST